MGVKRRHSYPPPVPWLTFVRLFLGYVMQRVNYSSRRPNDEEYDDEEYDEEQYSSDEPRQSDYTDNRNSQSNSSRHAPRHPRPPPQPTQRGSSNVSFFDGASNFEIHGGTFTSVNGNSYNGVVAPSWTTRSARPSAPRSKTTTTFFSDAKGFKINNGTFSNIGGDQYTVTIQNGYQGQPNPTRDPRVTPSYGQQQYSQHVPPASNYNRPTNTMPSRGRTRGTWGRQNSPREDSTSSFMQNAAASSSPTLSSQSPPPRFPSPQGNYGDTLQSERAIHSHSAPPSSNSLATSEGIEEIGDEMEMPVDPVLPPATSQSPAFATNTDSTENGFTAGSAVSGDPTPSFPQFSRTMAADVMEEGVMPNPVAIQGPIANRAEAVVESVPAGLNSNQAVGSSAVGPGPMATGEGGSSKPKFGKSWNLLNRVDKGKGKEKK